MNYDHFCAQCGGELTAGPHANAYTCEACSKAIDAFADAAKDIDNGQNRCVICGVPTIGTMDVCYGCEDDARRQGLI